MTDKSRREYFIADDEDEFEAFDWSYYLPSFAMSELISADLLARGMHHVLDLNSAMKLQRFRDRIYGLTGAGILVNHSGMTRRGARSIADQLAIGGKAAKVHSMHLSGKAFDISLAKWGTYTVEWLADQAIQFHWACVGIYPGKGFCHVDTRDLLTGQQVVFAG